MAYVFKIELEDMPVPVWRMVDVPDHFSLFRLHLAIQGAFGWENRHLYEFMHTKGSKKTMYGDSRLNDDGLDQVEEASVVFLRKFFRKPGDKLTYHYDFGDGWEHTVVLHQITSEQLLYPVCKTGSGKCPPEDVGGSHGYELMLASLNTPRDPEKTSYRVWLGLKPKENWDPNEFNYLETHKRLCLVVA
ncbi:plasmid pRiA4b ORF-3 family protein [Flavitalea antarctica]